MSEINNSNKIHLSGLNGLRAIAAIGVVISHITLALGTFNLNPFIFGMAADGTPKGLMLAGYGVSIFFALSGFLITYLLLLEKEKAPVNVPHFYMRRILRIWPLYYSFMLVAIAVMVYSGTGLQNLRGQLPYYLFFAANVPYIFNVDIPMLAHYWSVGVEEQFYIFWPWVIKKTGKNLQLIIAVLLIGMIALKLFTRYVIPGTDNSTIYQVFHVTRFQCMLIGALGAKFFYDKQVLFMRICTHKITQLLAWGAILLLILNRFHIASVLDQEFISVVTVVLIVGQCTVKNRIVNLEVGFMDFLGRISYGIYIIHPLVVFCASRVINRFTIPTTIRYPLVYAGVITATILLAYLSYRFMEKWFLRRKLKYSSVLSSGSKE